MSSSGYLVPPRKEPSKEVLWTETWKRIDRFLPDLRSDLALEEPSQEDSQTPDQPDAKGVAEDHPKGEAEETATAKSGEHEGEQPAAEGEAQ